MKLNTGRFRRTLHCGKELRRKTKLRLRIAIARLAAMMCWKSDFISSVRIATGFAGKAVTLAPENIGRIRFAASRSKEFAHSEVLHP